MEQNKVEILEALNNEKMYSLRGDEVGEMCSPEGDDTHRNDLSSETYNRKTVTVMILSRYENSWTKRI